MNQKIHFAILTRVGAILLIRSLYLKTRTKYQQSSRLQLMHIAVLLFSILAIPAYGQDKYAYLNSGIPMELKGTEYVLSRFEYGGKKSSVQYLLFINTRNGQFKRIDFPDNGRIQSTVQIKIDSLQINKIMMAIHSTNDDKHFNWVYPTQLFLFSIDGKEKVALTEERFFARTWEINNTTGSIVVTGYYDINGNHEHDASDEFQMLLYDLKTAKLISKINL
ncbi:hypothetical protein [Chitinophaga sp. S165]|uniref:hypothetical protein n=1 Tax=Chitinophaga sp. S165 TaxID=2135462 RepID=UPI000D71367D|nr:hypothetical protein [Chitinophaga sp. S165]PWV55603.1 hypothetical protein C7475_101109 [Chitinophaga sp. S165]